MYTLGKYVHIYGRYKKFLRSKLWPGGLPTDNAKNNASDDNNDNARWTVSS